MYYVGNEKGSKEIYMRRLCMPSAVRGAAPHRRGIKKSSGERCFLDISRGNLKL